MQIHVSVLHVFNMIYSDIELILILIIGGLRKKFEKNETCYKGALYAKKEVRKMQCLLCVKTL